MDEQQKLDYNKRCALFTTDEPKVLERDLKKAGTLESMQYHSDWNLIMEVVGAIEKTYDDFHGYFRVHISSNSCTIQGTRLRLNIENPHYAYFSESYGNDKKEATVVAIDKFLIWYNENKAK